MWRIQMDIQVGSFSSVTVEEQSAAQIKQDLINSIAHVAKEVRGKSKAPTFLL